MNAVEQLQALHFRMRTGDASWTDCIDWAIERLRRDEEGDDLDVVMLAAATRADEVDPLVLQIVERYIAPGALSDELAAGKLIVDLYHAYKEGKENVVSLEPKLWRLFYDLGQPSWLVMLARNCEYATDTEPFQRPFDQEFEYITRLWRTSKSKEEFLSKYDRKVSDSHDAM
ncbi:MAG: hypothetical protein KF892_23905 [Rhizobacter sp.]|nr:hypothetical protein [Rhizobacter sp.]